jgi:hypothetical protein
MNKWGSSFWVDLGERAGTTLIYGVIAMLTADANGVISGNAQQWWVVVGLPTALAVLKALLANLAHPESGASLVPHPPGPEVD